MPFLKVSGIWYLVSGIKNTKYKILNTKYCKSKGFTLIELLIVITIIGILASIAMVSYGGVQERARDAKRKSELDVIKKALELYYSDNNSYPATAWVYSGSGGRWIPGLTSNYIKTMPLDPKNTPACQPRNSISCFNYAYYSHTWCHLKGRDYILTTRLEGYAGSDLSQQQYTNLDGTDCSLWSESPGSGLYVLSAS